MDIKQLQTFLAVARLLNFRAAAEELHYSQSTVSDHIRTLEQELHTKLFERLGKKVFLNEHGQKLIPFTEKIVSNAQDIYHLFDPTTKIEGSLTIAAAETLCVSWLPPLLKKYSTLYPNVQITLKMRNCLDFPDLLIQNKIDVAFTLHDESHLSQLSQIDLFKSPAVFIASSNHPLARLEKISPELLSKQSFILTETNGSYSLDLKIWMESLGVPFKPIMELSSLEAIKQCVKNTLGITLLPYIVVSKELQSGELVLLSTDSPDFFIHTHMLYHANKWMSPPLAALKDLIKNTPI